MEQHLRVVGKAALAALLCVAAGILLRWPLSGVLGAKLVWITFYPAIMVSGLLGGFWSGMAAAALSVSFALWGHQIFGVAPYVQSDADLIGAAVFFANSLMMSLVAWFTRRAKRRSEEAQRQAEEANRAKSAFLAQMSHELRTPFNAILGFSAQLMRDEHSSPAQRESLGIIHRSANNLLGLINNVLDISRIESRQDRAHPAPCQPARIAQDVVELLGHRAAAKGLRLELTVRDGLPPWILSDGLRLRQILVNLVGNAVKFSDSGTVAIELGQQALPDGQAGFALAVSDQGPGIPALLQARVFEPFFKVHPEASTEGSGLGLAITRELARSLGGTISLESGIGRGSRFSCVFPCVAVPAPAQPAPAADNPCWRLAAGQAAAHCLIVDDNADNRKLLASLHRELGLGWTEAASGPEALAACRARARPGLDGHPHAGHGRLRDPGAPARAARLRRGPRCGRHGLALPGRKAPRPGGGLQRHPDQAPQAR